MTATLLAVALSLVSAVAYASAAVAQERLAARTRSAGKGGGVRLFADGAWWSAVALNAGGAVLHVAALRYGPLTLVQPLGALTLVAAVPLGARRAGRRVGPLEWRGTALTLAGLGVLLAAASGQAPDEALSLPEALAVAGATSVLVAALARPGSRPGLRHATASGIASGIASALTQTLTVSVTGDGGGAPLWQAGLVALLVAMFAAGGLLLAQTAYRGGLGAPLAVVTLANPVAAAVIGLSLLGERLQGGAGGLALAVVGAVAAGWGVVLLTRVPVDGGTAPADVAPEPARESGGDPTTGARTGPSTGSTTGPVAEPPVAAPGTVDALAASVTLSAVLPRPALVQPRPAAALGIREDASP